MIIMDLHLALHYQSDGQTEHGTEKGKRKEGPAITSADGGKRPEERHICNFPIENRSNQSAFPLQSWNRSIKYKHADKWSGMGRDLITHLSG